MEHEEARRLVSDWARGRLEAARAREVETHVRGCAACAEAADAAAGLDAEGRRLGATATAHPSAEALATYVETPAELATAALARIGAHVRGCEACRGELALAREAAAPGALRRLRAWFAPAGSPARALQPALAVAALLLAYPAWIGLVEHPRARVAAERRVQQAEARARAAGERPAPPAGALEPRGGGVAALVLRDATRGSGGTPELRLRPGQILQPVLVDVAIPWPQVAVALVREPGGRVWAIEGPREEFWDPANALAGLLVPAGVLTPGAYRLELGPATGQAPQVTARFRVLATPGAAAP